MRILVCCAMTLVLASFASAAFAQSIEPRGSVAGVIGAGRTWDDEGSIGAGPNAGGRFDWRVFGTTSVEVSVDVLRHRRSGGAFEADGSTALIGGSLLHRFGRSVAQPYVLGGYHIAQHSGSTTFSGRRTERDSTGHGYHFGGGLAFGIGKRGEIGPEARFYSINADSDSDPALAWWIGARFGIRF